jgi:single-stranded-DNA-specific exonuclease
MHRAWRLKEVDEGAIARLVRHLGVHAVTARCLAGRGILDEGTAGAFLQPRLQDLRPPVGMAGFAQAVARLHAALRGGERIGVFGDYDVDGVTAAALLVSFLRGVGGDVVVEVAERDAGYGFGEAQAARFVERGCRLVVTLDCGTSDVPAILLARARGVDVIVVDHHQVPERAEHPAHALLNPHRPDSTYAFRGLASVGLAFFLAAALRTALREAGWFAVRKEPDVRLLLDLVALGTIADLAPLREENRILVAAGLRELRARRRPGTAALLERAEIPLDRPLDEVDVGWRLGPRLNAPGRLGNAAPALDLLLAADPAQARACVAVCEELNVRRRAIQERMTAEALEDAQAQAGASAAIVVARPGWHPGVAGIVAAKLVEKFRRPAAVIAIDPHKGEGRGSLRSVSGFDLYRALTACREDLVRYGGHAQAAGVTVAADRVDALREGLARLAAAGAGAPPEVALDALVPLGEVDQRLAKEMHTLAPFGLGNDAPVMAARQAVVRHSRRVGEDGSHLKLTLECGRHATSHSAIAFRMGELDPGVGATVDVAFRPEINVWQGEERLELRIAHLRPTASDPGP